MIATDPAARLKMLAVIALAESEDGRWNPDGVKPYLGQISTEDLQKALAATRYCIIELHVVKELSTREDITAEKLMELLAATEHTAVQQALCEASVNMRMAKGAPLSVAEFNSMSAAGMTEPMKAAIRYALQNVPKGALPDFLSQTLESTQYLVINEFKRRDDPIGERLLALLDAKLSKSTRDTILAMIQHDRRITPDHLLKVSASEAVGWLLYEKLKGASLEEKQAWYKDAAEAARVTLIASCEYDLRKSSAGAESIISFLIDHASTPAVYTTIVRMLGKHMPIKQLLELREQTTDKNVVKAFNALFGDRYHELKEFLASL